MELYGVTWLGMAAAAAAATKTAATAPWWGPLTIQLIGSLGGVFAGAYLVGRRERGSRKEKKDEDMVFLAVTVSAVLEKFVYDCADVVADDGTSHGQLDYTADPQGVRVAQVTPPTLDYKDVNVAWTSLTGDLLDRVHALPLNLTSTRRALANHFDNDSPPYDDYFAERQMAYAVIAVMAAQLALDLRRSAKLAPLSERFMKTLNWISERLADMENRREAYFKRQVEMSAELAASISPNEPAKPA